MPILSHQSCRVIGGGCGLHGFSLNIKRLRCPGAKGTKGQKKWPFSREVCLATGPPTEALPTGGACCEQVPQSKAPPPPCVGKQKPGTVRPSKPIHSDGGLLRRAIMRLSTRGVNETVCDFKLNTEALAASPLFRLELPFGKTVTV